MAHRFDRFTDETKEQLVGILFTRAMGGMYQFGRPPNELSDYSAATSVHHVPTGTTIQLTRDILPINKKAWHLSLSFSDGINGVQAFQPDLASEWISLVFGRWTSQVQQLPGMSSSHIHHYLLLASPGENELPDLEAEFKERQQSKSAGSAS